jgi:hypothetical protein
VLVAAVVALLVAVVNRRRDAADDAGRAGRPA